MDFLWTTLGGKMLMTLLVSMVPVIELRGAIPLAVAHGLDYRIAIPLAIVGNLLPVPFIIFYIKKIFLWIRKKIPKLNSLVDRLEKRAAAKGDTVRKSAFWGLFLFVAIPLPGTGAWTGALIAAMLDIPKKKSVPAIALGVCLAAVLMGTLSLIFEGLFF